MMSCLSWLFRPPERRPALGLFETQDLAKAARDNKQYVDGRRKRDSTIVPETIKLYHSKVNDGLQTLQKSTAPTGQDMVQISFSHMHTAEAAEHFNCQNSSASITVMNFANG